MVRARSSNLCGRITILLIICCCSVAFAYGPPVQWHRTLGGNDGLSVQQTSDGGYIIAGRTGCIDSDSSTACDPYLIKLCREGTLARDLTCDGPVNFEDADILLRQWLQGQSILYPPADIYGPGDGIVNFLDLCIVADQWMKEP